jgi:hypothetical protein
MLRVRGGSDRWWPKLSSEVPYDDRGGPVLTSHSRSDHGCPPTPIQNRIAVRAPPSDGDIHLSRKSTDGLDRKVDGVRRSRAKQNFLRSNGEWEVRGWGSPSPATRAFASTRASAPRASGEEADCQ